VEEMLGKKEYNHVLLGEKKLHLIDVF